VRKRTAWASLVVAAGLVLGIVGWQNYRGSEAGRGSVQQVATTNFLSYSGYVAEYRKSLKSLTWPGNVLPTAKPMNTDTTGSYEVGAGEGDAVAKWECAWSKEYLDNRSTYPAAAKLALKQYATIRQMPVWHRAYSDPHTQDVTNDAISKAELGDPSVIESLYRANC
jgi:hypothetical protein